MENSQNTSKKSLREVASVVELIDTPFTFDDVMEAYEQSNIEFENTGYKLSEADLVTIKGDVPRTMYYVKNVEKRDFYREMLTKILTSMELKYIQGMAMISGVVLYYYTSDEVDKLFKGKKFEKNVKNNEAMNTTSAINLNQGIKISDVLTKDLKKKIVKVLTEIFHSKFLPLTDNKFEKYRKLNKVFLELVKKHKKIVIDESFSMTYMNQTLSFFVNEFDEMEDKYFILSMILATPNNVLFIILFLLYDSIKNKKTINIDQKNFFKKIIEVESDFLKTQSSLSYSKKPHPLRIFLTTLGVTIFVGVVGVGAGMILQNYKNE